MNEQNGPYRNYCITWNFPDDTEITSQLIKEREQALLDLPTKYIVFQLERGNENHRLHYQGILILNNSQRHSYLRKRLLGAHIERCHDIQKSIEYCTKTDTRVKEFKPIIRGEPPTGRGHRSDISRINDLIKEGATISQIWESVPNSTLLHIRSIIEIRKFIRPDIRSRIKKVWILWGDTGSGKTGLVRSYFTEEELFVLPPNSGTNNVFFDFYDPRQHRAVLVDDFYGFWKWSAMLQICDRYPMQVQTRNSSPTYFYPEHLIFTSNKDPRQWYPNMNYATLKRRIHEIHHFSSLTTLLWGDIKKTVDFDGRISSRRTSTESEPILESIEPVHISSRNSRIRQRESIPSSDEESTDQQRSQKNRKRNHITIQEADVPSDTDTVVYSEEELSSLPQEEALSNHYIRQEEIPKSTWNEDETSSCSSGEIYQQVQKKVKIKDIPFP